VFDLGGGTFDVTVIELRPNEFVTLATDGDVQLGGRDFDVRIAEFAAQKFEDAHRLDPRDDPRARARLMRQAEDAKHSLSARQHALMQVTHEGKSLEVEVTRVQFEGLTAPLLERCAHTTREVLYESGLKWSDIDRLLLVGGATRMPMISRKLTELSGLVPEQCVNPDEAVARGAAIYASYLLSQQGKSTFPLSFRIVDVNSHSLGIQGIDVATGRNENAILIPRNTPLPTKATSKFVTKKDKQQSIMIKVLEGESLDPTECILIGKAVLRRLPDLPEGHPLEVTYSYGSNGLLQVELLVTGTDVRLRMELQRGDKLSDSKVNTWKQIVTAGHGFKTFEEMLEAVLGQLGRRLKR
ncbi:MAG: Hsp70 family protein, partial [Planctomycetota bacterium]